MIYILDTNILIHLLNEDQASHERLNSLDPSDLVRTTYVSVRELYWGAHNSQKVAHNVQRIENLLRGIEVIGCSMESSKTYGKLRANFTKRGLVFHDPDLVIASIALTENGTIVSNDQVFIRHPIQGLEVENWLAPH